MSRTENYATVKGANSYKLYKFIEDEYSKSKMDNSTFARYATEKLGFFVNANHVFTRLNELGIKNNRKIKLKEEKDLIKERLETLEMSVAIMSKEMAKITRDINATIEKLVELSIFK